MQKDHTVRMGRRDTGERRRIGVNKTCGGGFGEDLPSGTGKIRTKGERQSEEDAEKTDKKRKRGGCIHTRHYTSTHKRYSFYIAVIGKRDD